MEQALQKRKRLGKRQGWEAVGRRKHCTALPYILRYRHVQPGSYAGKVTLLAKRTVFTIIRYPAENMGLDSLLTDALYSLVHHAQLPL